MQSMTADTSLLTVKRTTTFLVSLVVALSCGTNYVGNFISHAGGMLEIFPGLFRCVPLAQ